MAMGADSGVFIHSETDTYYDSYSYAQMLAAYFKNKEFNYIFCGKQSQDTDAGLTGSMLAELLGLPYVTNAVGLEFSGDVLLVRRQGDTGQEVIELPSPGLVTCSNDMNDPRIPNLKGIMQSKRKPVESVTSDELQAALSAVKTKILGYEEKPGREAGKKYEGEADEIARQVARILDETENVI